MTDTLNVCGNLIRLLIKLVKGSAHTLAWCRNLLKLTYLLEAAGNPMAERLNVLEERDPEVFALCLYQALSLSQECHVVESVRDLNNVYY